MCVKCVMAVVDVRYLSIIYTMMLIMRQPQNTNYGHSQRCPIVPMPYCLTRIRICWRCRASWPLPPAGTRPPPPRGTGRAGSWTWRRLEGHYLSASCHAILCRYKREMLSEVSNRDIDVIHQYIKGGHLYSSMLNWHAGCEATILKTMVKIFSI